MSTRRYFPVWKQTHHGRSYLPSITVLFAVAAIALGAGVILALPDDPDLKPQAASAAASAPETTGSTNTAADESLCDKQAWPYIDQRCAQRVEAARGMREVRIVTDKGNSVTVKSPEPIVEPKRKPAPPPVVAQAEKPIGPSAAPVAESPPKVEKVVAAPQQQPQPQQPQQPQQPLQQQAAPAPQNPAPPAVAKPAPAPNVQVTVTPRAAPAPQNPAPQSAPAPAPAAQASVAANDPVARNPSDPSANMRNAPVPPVAASNAPMTAGYDAFAESSKKSKSERQAERAERRAADRAERTARREAKRQKMIEGANGGVPEEVATTVRSLRDGQDSRRTRNADRARSVVPDEVVEAVEQAAASETRGRRSREVVVGSPRGGGRVYVVPSDAIGSW
ncbi:MAG TPA: hypothetical protein VFK79_02920 [Xanthobacteraceae bacterium]|nr:hypothetical protein [Xanthobacteraceae bacterium]